MRRPESASVTTSARRDNGLELQAMLRQSANRTQSARVGAASASDVCAANLVSRPMLPCSFLHWKGRIAHRERAREREREREGKEGEAAGN